MKTTTLKYIAVLAAIATLALSPAHALTAAQKDAIKASVANVPTLELPPKAAQVVAQASKEDKQDTALALVREIVSKNQAIVPSLVASLVTALPDSAVIIAATAADLAIDQTADIAKAVAKAVPDQTLPVVYSLVKLAPKSAGKIVEAIQVASETQKSSIGERQSAVFPGSPFFPFDPSSIVIITSMGRLDFGDTWRIPIEYVFRVGPYGAIAIGTR